MPTLIIDNSIVPLGSMYNDPNATNFMINAINQWNSNPSFLPLFFLEQQNLSSLPNDYNHRINNGVNEITFDLWDPSDSNLEDIGITVCDFKSDDYQIAPSGEKLLKFNECSIFINPYYDFYMGDNAPSNCLNEFSIKHGIVHEVGHFLTGIGHTQLGPLGNNGIMMDYEDSCWDGSGITPSNWDHLKNIYLSLDTVKVDIPFPTAEQALIINQVYLFKATILPFLKNKHLSNEQIKTAEDSMVWTSSEDGVIANGNNVNVSNLSGGWHDLTVTVGQPGDAIYGEGASSFYVIDTVSDIVDPYGRTVAYPFPCVRNVARSDGACLFTVLDSVDVAPQFLNGCSQHPTRYDINPSPFSEDLLPNGQGENFYLHKDPIPSCDSSLHYSDSRREYFAYSSWVYDSITENSVDFHLYSQLDKIIGTAGIKDWYYRLPLVDPEIYVETPSDCSVTNVTEKCGIDITWDNKYFVPDAGVFYKASGSSSWSYVAAFPDNNSGSLRTSKVVGVDGGEVMVVQYSRDVRTPGSNTLLINAPDGLMAGPFPVKAISSNTTPTDPQLDAATTTCSNNYCIELTGQHFGPSAFVDIRADLGTTVDGEYLGSVSGNDIYSRSDTHIMFPIQDLDLQNRLANSTYGLCFWVVDPPEFSDGKCVTRPTTPAAAKFMGQTVQSYNTPQYPQDIEWSSFEVNNNGTELEIWGNSWKKIVKSYTVTPNTVLEFDFISTQQQAGINGVGLIMSGSSSLAQSRAWQVYGTRRDWGNQSHHNYSGNQWKTYRIPIGETFTGQISHMVFLGDEEVHVGQDVIYKNPKLIEVASTAPIIENIVQNCKNKYCVNVLGKNFDATASVIVRENLLGSTLTKEFKGNDIYARSPLNGQERLFVPTREVSWQQKYNTNGLCFRVKSNGQLSNEVCKKRPVTAPMGFLIDSVVESYSTQDLEYDAHTIASNKLKMWGNSWKKIQKNYTVTPNTVLEFEFISNKQEPGINGIGFIKDGYTNMSSNRVWQVYGTKTWGIQSHHDYSGNQWKTYSIPIGQTFTGQVSHMVFIGDEDVHVGQNTVYKNVRMVESVPKPAMGFVYDPIKTGHGVHISQNLNGDYLMYFYTYDQSGKPEWYLATPNFINNQLMGDLLKVSYDSNSSSASVSVAGNFTINYSNTAVNNNVNCNGLNRDYHLGAFNWNINGQSGSWCLQPTFKNSDFTPSDPAANSGVWNEPTYSGWGISMQSQLKLGDYSSYAVVYYYDSQGKPRWSSGFDADATEGEYSYNMFHYDGYPRTSTGTVTSQSNGFLNLNFESGRTANININYPKVPFGDWNRSNVAISRVAY